MTAAELRSRFIRGPQGYTGWTGPMGGTGNRGMTGTVWGGLPCVFCLSGNPVVGT